MGPFLLTVSTIDAVVTSTSPGIFLLGKTDKHQSFHVLHIGRADEDIRATLKHYVRSYAEFRFEYCASSKDAFEKECGLYHTLRPVDTPAHPLRPNNSDFRCPACMFLG
jgi:hypothetical protein